MQFDTRFEHKQAAMETVTFLQAKDGTWKAAGYDIKYYPSIRPHNIGGVCHPSPVSSLFSWRNRAARLVNRCTERTFRTAILIARGCPITTTSCFPLVT